MPYFGVDDGFNSHRKAIKAGLAAIGLWTMSGSWSNKEGTDGFVPDYIASRFSPDYEQLAAKLVEVRLWEVDEVDGEKGWRFHDWTGAEDGVRRNYTREETVQKRREWSARQARSRARQGKSEDVTRDNTRDSRSDNTRDSRVTPTVTTRVSHGRSHGVPVPDPDPVPSPKPLNSKPEVVDLGSPLTNEDQSEVDESQLPYAKRRRKRWCDEHGSPDDRLCTACKQEHGDRAYWSKQPLSFRGEK